MSHYDFEKLADELKKIKDSHPDKTDIQVASEDTIKFEVAGENDGRGADRAVPRHLADRRRRRRYLRSDDDMPIHAPHPHLYDSVKLEVAKAKLGHAGRKSSYAALNLVAYIDMMTMFVIFLLMSFSATGEILFVQKNIVLPDAQNWTDLERAPVIGVSKDVVTLDGSQVATADELHEGLRRPVTSRSPSCTTSSSP